MLPEGRGQQVALTVHCFLTVLTVALVIIQRQKGKIESTIKVMRNGKYCVAERL